MPKSKIIISCVAKCGSIPVPGDVFRYISPYGSDYESIVKEVDSGGITSTRGVRYRSDEIIIITKSYKRRQKLDNLL